MDKRVTFRGWLLPAALVFPQLAVTAVFFFYPAGQAVWQSLFIPDPFGLKSQFVGTGNFEFLLNDPFYRASFVTTAVFSTLVTLVSMGVALWLAVLADRLIKSSGTYRTLLIWPYAVAPAVAGVLWLFMFNTRVGLVSWYLGLLGYDWNHVLNGEEAMALVVIASSWGRISYNFLFFPGRATGNTRIRYRGCRDRRRTLLEAILDNRFSAPVANNVLPAGRQRRLRLL